MRLHQSAAQCYGFAVKIVVAVIVVDQMRIVSLVVYDVSWGDGMAVPVAAVTAVAWDRQGHDEGGGRRRDVADGAHFGGPGWTGWTER
jgi:hypothetical protein